MVLNTFQAAFINSMNMVASNHTWAQRYHKKNSALNDHITYYDREGLYTFILADYTIDQPFSLTFNSDAEYLRFGLVSKGTSRFNIENTGRNTFYPSPFLTLESGLKGDQTWDRGQHYQAIEFLVHTTYLNKLSNAFKTDLIPLDHLETNHVYLALPPQVLEILKDLKGLAQNSSLTPLFLESQLLACIAHICAAQVQGDFISFSRPSQVKISISEGRSISLGERERDLVKKAKVHVDQSLPYPPTVQELSKLLNLSEQKLTYGFKALYKVTLGQYIKDQKLMCGANLLTTSQLGLKEISLQLGYTCPSNFCHAFKQKYHQSPLAYRRASHWGTQ